MSVATRRLPHSDEVAPFEAFDFDLEGIGALIYRTINERLEQHLAEYPARLSLPARWDRRMMAMTTSLLPIR